MTTYGGGNYRGQFALLLLALGKMNQVAATPSSSGSAVLAMVGLCLAPLLVAIDSAVAMADGWSPRSAGTFGLLAFVAAGAVGLVALLAILSGRFRRLLRRHTTGCLVFGAASLVALAGAELALARLWPQPPFHCRTPGTRYVYEPYLFQLPGASPIATVTFNSQGVRGAEWPPRDQAYRILCVGGSTTECLYIDDGETWPAQLAQAIPAIDGRPVWVGAAAVSEYGVAEHLKFIETSPLVDKVDCLVMMIGANDLVREILGLEVEARREPLWLRSNLMSTLRYVWNGALGAGIYYDHDGRTLRLRRLGRTIKPFDFEERAMARRYGERLRKLIDAAKQRDVRLVLVTEPVLWDDFLGLETVKHFWLTRTDPQPREWSELNAGVCRDAIDEYNDVLIDVARETGCELIDAAPKVTGWDENFYDDYHLSRHGCGQLAKELAPHFLVGPPVSSPPAAFPPAATTDQQPPTPEPTP